MPLSTAARHERRHFPAELYHTRGSCRRHHRWRRLEGRPVKLARWRSEDAGPVAVLVGLVIIALFFESQNSNFLSSRNLSNLVLQMAVTSVLAVGVVLVMITGEIDLSLGSVAGASAALLGVLLTEHGWPAWAAIGVTLAFGLAVGLLQGAVTVLVGVPSFLVTLGGFLAFSGVQLALVGNAGEVRISNKALLAIANDYVAAGVAWLLVIAVVVALVVLEVARRRAWREAGFTARSWWRSGIAVGIPVIGLVLVVSYLNRYFGVPYLLVLLLTMSAGLGWITRRTLFGRHLYAVGATARPRGVPGCRLPRSEYPCLPRAGCSLR